MADNLTPAQRSYCMSRVKGKDTNLEKMVRSALHRRGLRFRKHVRELPGRPDIVFRSARLVIFIDGDFWHGYNFPQWCETVSPFWQKKIEGNRTRDDSNVAKLNGMGWTVIRIWQHEVKEDLDRCIQRIEDLVRAARP